MCYQIKDETLKKYVIEEFLDKIKNLTPIQSANKTFGRFKNFNKKNYEVLNETKILHKKKNHFSKIQITEFSVLFIMLNYLDIASKKIEEISEIAFLSEKNESLKKLIIESLFKGDEEEVIKKKVSNNFELLINEIYENSSIQIILKEKKEEDLLELLDELLSELKELKNLQKIESLEKELINNLDENSYSELIKLKSQLNRE